MNKDRNQINTVNSGGLKKSHPLLQENGFQIRKYKLFRTSKFHQQKRLIRQRLMLLCLLP